MGVFGTLRWISLMCVGGADRGRVDVFRLWLRGNWFCKEPGNAVMPMGDIGRWRVRA